MANRDSQHTTPEHNPQKVAKEAAPHQKAAALPVHLDAMTDLFTACRWALACRDMAGDQAGTQADEMRTMFEAIRDEVGRLDDDFYFGDVVEHPLIQGRVHHLRGLLHLVDEALTSVILSGSRGYPAQSVTPEGVGRLLDLMCRAFNEMRLDVARLIDESARAAQATH
jgi:hypothetical protein